MNRKPIYLYIVPFFPAPNYWRGGFFLDAVKALMDDGRYDVRVFSKSDMGHDYDYEGIHVYNFVRKSYGSAQYFETFIEIENNLRLAKEIKRVGIKWEDIAVCHVHDHNHYVHYADYIKRKNPRCLTLVHHHYGGWYDIEFGRLHNFPLLTDLRYLHLSRLYRKIDAHVFISEHSRKCFGLMRSQDSCGEFIELRQTLMFGKFLPKLLYRDSYIWYNGVDTSIFTPSSKPKTNSHVIGCVGNFNPGKSQIDLVHAFVGIKEYFPDARLRFVGSGKMLHKCKDCAIELGVDDSIEFIKEVPHHQLADYYRALDLFVMPSVNEGFCCVNVEANACGVPVIACEGLPFEELLTEDGKKSWLIPKHNPSAISDQVIKYFTKPIPQRLVKNLDSCYLASNFLDWLDEKRNSI